MRRQNMSLMMVGTMITAILVVGRSDPSESDSERARTKPWRMHTLFSVECQNYFDWQTVGVMHSFRKSGHPGRITRLLSCTDEEMKSYKGMDLAPTLLVPSMSRHPKTGDWYPAINKPAGVAYWLNHSKDASDVDWVVIMDADMIVRGPILPWELGAEKGNPIGAHYGYLIGCDNVLAQLHTKHPQYCAKVGGIVVMHIDDLRVFAPLWLSKTEEVRQDREHWATNITGDIYNSGWISEMYGYAFSAAELQLPHKITDDLMIYPGYVPQRDVEPIILHYGLTFSVGNWSFNKLQHYQDDIVYKCGQIFDPPPYPREVEQMESDSDRRRGLFLSIECINTLNEGLLVHHAAAGCPKPAWSKYLSFLKSQRFSELSKPKTLTSEMRKRLKSVPTQPALRSGGIRAKIHTIFSTECSAYFDWQTVGLMHSFHLSGQPGNITRLLSCTETELMSYKGHDLAPTHYVPSISHHPLTRDGYPAINKPASILHWLNHADIDADYIVILDADMILRGPITPWEFNAAKGHPVSTPYGYLLGCDNELTRIHTRPPEACDKVGVVIIMHIDDLLKFALFWLHKTKEVQADKEHYAPNSTGDIYGSGWISEMYGESFGAAESNPGHTVNSDILIYPGYYPELGVEPRVFHYGVRFDVGNWSFDKADWRNTDMVNICGSKFPDPPDISKIQYEDNHTLRWDKLRVECFKILNEALYLHHKRRNCSKSVNSVIQVEGGRWQQRRKATIKLYRDLQYSLHDPPEKFVEPPSYWLVILWTLFVFSFLVILSEILSRKKVDRGERTMSKELKQLKPV